MRFFVCLLLVGLVACGADDVSRPEAIDVYTEGEMKVNPEPGYVLVDGDQYGYEMETGEVLLVSFLGEVADEYQFLVKSGEYYSVVYRMKPPYEFLESLEFSGSELVDRGLVRLQPEMIATAMLLDASKGQMEPRRRVKDGVAEALWVDSDNRPAWHPAAQ